MASNPKEPFCSSEPAMSKFGIIDKSTIYTSPAMAFPSANGNSIRVSLN